MIVICREDFRVDVRLEPKPGDPKKFIQIYVENGPWPDSADWLWLDADEAITLAHALIIVSTPKAGL